MADTRLQQLAKTDRNPVEETEYQNLLAQGGDTGGVDFGQVPSVQDYIAKQFVVEDPALKELIMGMRAREDPLDIYTRLETEAGLPMMRETATSLMKEIANIEDYLDQIEPMVAGRTRESLVTEPQRVGMVAAERKEPLQTLTRLGTGLGRLGERMGIAERGIGTKTELAVRGQEMALEPLQLRYQTMVDRNVRMLTGFTEDRQTQLDMLWDKLNRQRQLEDREWELANLLAGEEQSYLQGLRSTAAEAGASLTGGESADEILAIIGRTAAEAIGWERQYKEKGRGTTDWGDFDSMWDEIVGWG